MRPTRWLSLAVIAGLDETFAALADPDPADDGRYLFDADEAERLRRRDMWQSGSGLGMFEVAELEARDGLTSFSAGSGLFEQAGRHL